jgi:hypothetical protein
MSAKVVDWTYLQAGANALPSGGTLTLNPDGTGSADVPSPNGYWLHLDAALLADGDNVRVTVTLPDSSSFQRTIAASVIAPDLATASVPLAFRGTLTHQLDKIGAVLGTAAAVAATVAAVATAPAVVPIAIGFALYFTLAAGVCAIGSAWRKPPKK